MSTAPASDSRWEEETVRVQSLRVSSETVPHRPSAVENSNLSLPARSSSDENATAGTPVDDDSTPTAETPSSSPTPKDEESAERVATGNPGSSSQTPSSNPTPKDEESAENIAAGIDDEEDTPWSPTPDDEEDTPRSPTPDDEEDTPRSRDSTPSTQLRSSPTYEDEESSESISRWSQDSIPPSFPSSPTAEDDTVATRSRPDSRPTTPTPPSTRPTSENEGTKEYSLHSPVYADSDYSLEFDVHPPEKNLKRQSSDLEEESGSSIEENVVLGVVLRYGQFEKKIRLGKDEQREFPPFSISLDTALFEYEYTFQRVSMKKTLP